MLSVILMGSSFAPVTTILGGNQSGNGKKDMHGNARSTRKTGPSEWRIALRAQNQEFTEQTKGQWKEIPADEEQQR